jgi:acetyl-CoA C-acetyltransferase
MPDAVIVDAVRTPIGRAGRGSLAAVRADDLASIPLRALVERNPDVDFSETVDVMMGAMSATGEQGYNIGRTAALLAGIDERVPALAVNRGCASSLQTLRMAFHAISAGEGDQYIAAGVEAISRAAPGTKMDPESKHPKLDGSPGGLFDAYMQVGLTAENVAERCGVTREHQDQWAFTSQRRAAAARDAGHFDEEIVPVSVPAHERPDRSGNLTHVPERVVTRDDGIRDTTTLEGLARLKPAFKANGTVTAGNACAMSDGAAAVLVMSAEKAAGLGVRARARVLATSVAAIRPEIMGLGPIPAIRRLLAQARMTMDDIDIVEINETFAAQVIPCKEELGIPDEKLNPFGGAIALGHPYGMTGARLAGALLNGLRAVDGTYGIASTCITSGMGQAALIQRID